MDTGAQWQRFSPVALARIAGILSLIGIAFGAFDIGHIRGALIVAGDSAATADNIVAHEALYRAGFTGHIVELLCNAAGEIIAFYLFWRVNVIVAAMALFCGFVGIAIEGLDMLGSYLPLKLAAESGALAAFTAGQRQALAYFSVQLQDAGLLISFVFYGADELLSGYLMFKSRFLPRFIGVLLGISGFCYLFNSLLTFAAPALDAKVYPGILFACFPGEFLSSLWLATVGLNAARWRQWRKVVALTP
jgi:Domain of unknown function (DUF4386)